MCTVSVDDAKVDSFIVLCNTRYYKITKFNTLAALLAEIREVGRREVAGLENNF